jgi:putative transposase
MPRQARIDVQGVLQHVMVRGIEKRDIFLDDHDRSRFLDRLSNLLTKTKTDCLAWSLLSNHAHLLLRPTTEKLSDMMRRLLTGYAVVFNLRYHRSGHLFQNRYKAIACEEESYLLELVRYIHLNPIRAGLVLSMEQLDTYKWCGHAVLMGQCLFAGQRTDEVLTRFGDHKNTAVARYREFVADGIALGKRDELVGGGLRRYLKFSGSNEFQAYDERILGSGEFVEQVWHEPQDPTSPAAPLPLDELMERVAAVFGIDVAALSRGCKCQRRGRW